MSSRNLCSAQSSKGFEKNVTGVRQQVNKEERSLFVGGIPKQASREEVFNFLSSYGYIASFSMPYNGIPSNHKGFAKVMFSAIEETNNFLSVKNLTLKGLSIGAKLWESKTEHISLREMPAENKLFLRMRSPISISELEEYFSQFGEIDTIELKKDYKTNNQRKIGFVIFKSSQAAKVALELGRAHLIANNKILVQASKSKQEIANYIKIQKKTQQKPTKTMKMKYLNADYPSIEDQICKNAELADRQLNYKISSFGNSSQEPIGQLDPKPSNIRTVSSIQGISKWNMKGQTGNQVSSSKLRRAQPVSKNPDTDSSESAKPCSKNWNHASVIQNHRSTNNLVFRIHKENNSASQEWRVANAVVRISSQWLNS